MSISLSSLADIFSVGIHKEKWQNCKPDLDDYVTAKEYTLAFKYFSCKKNYKNFF